MTNQIKVTPTSNTQPIIFDAADQIISLSCNTFSIGEFDSNQNLLPNTSGILITPGKNDQSFVIKSTQGSGGSVGLNILTNDIEVSNPIKFNDNLWMIGSGQIYSAYGFITLKSVLSVGSLSLITGAIYGASNTVFSTGLSVATPWTRDLGQWNQRSQNLYVNPNTNQIVPFDTAYNSRTINNLKFLTATGPSAGLYNTFTNNNNFPVTVKVFYTLDASNNNASDVGLATWIQLNSISASNAGSFRFGYNNTNAPQASTAYTGSYPNSNTGGAIFRLQPGDFFNVYYWTRNQPSRMNNGSFGETLGYNCHIDIIEY